MSPRDPIEPQSVSRDDPRPPQAPVATVGDADDGPLEEVLEAELGPALPSTEPSSQDQPLGQAADAGAQGGSPSQPESAERDEGDAGEAVALADLSPEELERELAALLFAAHEPLSTARLATLLGDLARKRVEAGLEALSSRLEASGLPFELRAIAGGWQLFTTPDMAETVAALVRVRRDDKVSPAALETLAVVAYRQPVTKAEVEAIRGVQVGPILRSLVDRGLARVTGRSPDPGHPLLYGTTRQFLDVFGLENLDALPRDGELLRD